MKSITQFLWEAEEDPAAVAAPKPEKDDEPNTSLFKFDVKPEKSKGAIIYDKILNTIQLVQYNSSKDLEIYFDLNEGSMNYINSMKPGDSNEDENSILTVIWTKIGE